MIIEGSPFSHEIMFNTGLPTGVVTYSLLGNDGTPLSGYNSLTVAPAVGAVSLVINIPSSANTVATPLFETRTLVWSYNTAGGLVSNRIKYRVDKDIPFPVSVDSVRHKLGVESHEVHINLLDAYSELLAYYPDDAFVAYETSGDRNTLLVANAIEAMAALSVIPSLQLSVAKAEDSGTNSYQRFSSIDWQKLIEKFTDDIAALSLVVAPVSDPFVGYTVFFAVGAATDPFTGATA